MPKILGLQLALVYTQAQQKKSSIDGSQTLPQKTAKNSYFSQLIAVNSHNPCLLYNTINSALNGEDHVPLQSSEAVCNKFFTFFVDKVSSSRSSTLSSVDLAVHAPCSSLPISFQPFALPELEKIV